MNVISGLCRRRNPTELRMGQREAQESDWRNQLTNQRLDLSKVPARRILLPASNPSHRALDQSASSAAAVAQQIKMRTNQRWALSVWRHCRQWRWPQGYKMSSFHHFVLLDIYLKFFVIISPCILELWPKKRVLWGDSDLCVLIRTHGFTHGRPTWKHNAWCEKYFVSRPPGGVGGSKLRECETPYNFYSVSSADPSLLYTSQDKCFSTFFLI